MPRKYFLLTYSVSPVSDKSKVFSSAIGYWGIRILIMLFVNNVVQIAIITSVICSLAKKASSTD